MKLPRDTGGEELAILLGKYNYQIIRLTGSHIRLTSNIKGTEHHITIPRHKSIKLGTLNDIINDVTSYLEIDKKEIIENLFNK